MLRQLVKRSPVVYRSAMALRERRRQRRQWPHAERLSNPAKHALLRAVATEYGLRVFVETGTYEGETVYWLRRDFDRLVTVEFEPRLCETAAMRLAPHKNVTVICGDGAQVLPDVLATLDQAALFWLDSHGCTTKSAAGGSPALRELELVLAHPFPHVALIDDVRLLGSPGWPSLDDLGAAADRHGRPFEVEDDIARVLPRT